MEDDKKKMTVLDEARECVDGPRQRDYGHPRDNFENIAEGWRVIFDNENISPRDVAKAMIWLKICRDKTKQKRDNLVDIAGYARTAELIEEPANGSK